MPLDSKKTWDACGEAFDRYTTAEDSFSENIERPAIESLIGDVKGVCALDLGCGSGTYSVWLAGRGAQITGLDISATMLSLARNRAREADAQTDFCIGDINKPLPFDDETFDLVMTATALHYVGDLKTLMQEVARVMKRGAMFIASVLHPISTAMFPFRDNDAADRRWESRRDWRINYFGPSERTIETPWKGFGPVAGEGERITCCHHTTSDYCAAIQRAGLVMTDLIEPSPSEEFARKNPERYEEAISVPIYLMIKSIKP